MVVKSEYWFLFITKIWTVRINPDKHYAHLLVVILPLLIYISGLVGVQVGHVHLLIVEDLVKLMLELLLLLLLVGKSAREFRKLFAEDFLTRREEPVV